MLQSKSYAGRFSEGVSIPVLHNASLDGNWLEQGILYTMRKVLLRFGGSCIIVKEVRKLEPKGYLLLLYRRVAAEA